MPSSIKPTFRCSITSTINRGSAGGQLWEQLSGWGQSRKLLSPTELGVLRVAASVPMKIPSEKQCLKVIGSLRKLRSEGCMIGADLSI